MKIACVSASVLPEERDEVMSAGCDDFVRKPYARQAIFDCIQQHLGVCYRVKESSLADERPSEAICPEALAAIPDELRAELDHALVWLDVGRITAIIHCISDIDPTLGGALEEHAEKFSFTPILRGLQRIPCLCQKTTCRITQPS